MKLTPDTSHRLKFYILQYFSKSYSASELVQEEYDASSYAGKKTLLLEYVSIGNIKNEIRNIFVKKFSVKALRPQTILNATPAEITLTVGFDIEASSSPLTPKAIPKTNIVKKWKIKNSYSFQKKCTFLENKLTWKILL